LLPYRANINKSIQETFTDNHFFAEEFRIIVSDVDPTNVILLTKYPKKWRFYNFDKEEYFTREFEQVDYEHIFVFKNYVFYSPTGYLYMESENVIEELTESEINITRNEPNEVTTSSDITSESSDDLSDASTVDFSTTLAPESSHIINIPDISIQELASIKEMCWNNSTHCYSDNAKLMQETLTDHFVVQMIEQLQVVGTHKSNQFYIHDLVTGFDFCFPNTIKTHSDCATKNDKFAKVISRFPIIRENSPFLQRRKEFIGKTLEEAAKLSRGHIKTECESFESSK